MRSIVKLKMVEPRYVLSFTAGGLLYHESTVVTETFVRSGRDWQRTIDTVERENLLQSRTVSTTRRKLREVRKRLQLLTGQEISLLASGARLDQKLLLWLACCLRYQLLGDFARDVLRSKYLQMDLFIGPADIEQFVEAKSVWHEELEDLAASTRAKLQTVMLRMLRESEMLTDDGIVSPPLMSAELQSAILAHSQDYFSFFPVAVPQ